MKIGIMTMHRVQNMGSVLQAYALQYKIKQLGYESELIDYVFPPVKKTHFGARDLVSLGLDALQGFPAKRKKNKINAFRAQYLHCSEKTYNREKLLAEPPHYDLYCTGSDQVWNPIHIGMDTSFMMDFAPDDAPRIAYASSFSSKEITEPYFSLYASHLSKYKSITVREQSGIDIVRQMTGKEAAVVCDPTMLLSAEEWQSVAEVSNVELPKEYILVYLLRYMFDPRPGFYNIVQSVRNALKLPVYQVNSYNRDSFYSNVRPLNGLGPADFIRLVKNASFLVTDSFHGTVFATIFNVPMIGVVKDASNGDGRIATLRTKVEGYNSVVCHNKPFKMCNDISLFKNNPKKVDEMRHFSTEELKMMIE